VLGALQANDRFNRPDNYATTLKSRFEAVTLENLQGAAEQVIKPESLTWVIVGDRSKIEPALQDLNIAEIEFMGADGKMIE